MKKNKRKFKLEIPHIHLIADTLILVLGIFLGAFLYAQLAPKPAVNKPSISVQGTETDVDKFTQAAFTGNVNEEEPGPPTGPQQITYSNCYSGGACQVKLVTPSVEVRSGEVVPKPIKGQNYFQFNIYPKVNDINANNSTVSIIDAMGNENPMYCFKELSDTNNLGFKVTTSTYTLYQTYEAYCDTLAIENSTNYKIRFVAKDTAGNLLRLVPYTTVDPITYELIVGQTVNFKAFNVDNTFNITSPTQNQEVSGSVSLNATLSGNAKSLRFSISGLTGTIEATRVSYDSSIPESRWHATWDTTNVGNGSHTVNISFESLGGLWRDNTANSVTVTVKNPICEPSWQCPDWSTITCIGGTQTRTCTEKCSGKTKTETQPCQININTNTNTNTNVNTNTNTNTNTSCTKLSSCPADTEWSKCENNKQTRSCSDGCGGTITEEKECNVTAQACTPINTCPDTIAWSFCSKDGKQTRSCDDGCGNTITQTRDCTALKITYPAANQEIEAPQPEIKGIAQGGSSVRVHWVDVLGNDSQSPELILVPSTNVFTFPIPKPLTEGTYKVYAEAFSPDGSSSLQSESVSFKILAPEVVMLIPQAGQQLTASVTLTAEVKRSKIYTLEFYRDKVGGLSNVLIGKATVQATNPNVYQYFWDTSDTDNGEYDIYARVRDAARVKIYISNKVRVTINHDITTLVPEEPAPAEPQPNDDTDGDRVPDVIEKELGSDPNNPDTNGDGISDGEAIEQGKSPTGEEKVPAELVQKIQKAQEQIAEFKADEPKYGGTVNKNLQVANLSSVTIEIGKEGILIEGKGPANTILTIYIYSRPIVVTTKTDENGNFKYILEKDITEGEHEVYVTINDETGKVIEKSEPFGFFVKKARAVSREEYFRGDVNVQGKTPSYLKVYIVLCLGIILAVLVGFVVYRLIKGPEKPSQRIKLKEDTSIKSK